MTIDDIYLLMMVGFVGPLRIIAFFLLFYILYNLTISIRPSQNGLNFFVPRLIQSVSIAIIGSFLLIQVNSFDLMVVLILMGFSLLLSFLNLKWRKPLKPQLKKIYTRIVLYLVIRFEKNRPLLEKENFIKPRRGRFWQTRKQRNVQLIISISIILFIYFTRFLFLTLDNYLFSSSWDEDLRHLELLANQNWLNVPDQSMAEFAIIQIYGFISGLQNFLLPQSFALIQISLLGCITYWCVQQITGKHSSGVVSALVMSFGFSVLPLSLDTILQHKTAYTALILAIPYMVYSLYPKDFQTRHANYFNWSLLLSLSILLLNPIVGILILFPFQLIAFFMNTGERKKYNFEGIQALLVSIVILLVIFWFTSFRLNLSLEKYLSDRMFSYDYYTYNPSIIIKFSNLVWYYLALTLLSIFISFSKRKNFSRWKINCAFSIYTLTALIIYILFHGIFDLDIFNQIVSIFLAIQLGIIFYLFSEYFGNYKRHFKLFAAGGLLILFIIHISGITNMNFKLFKYNFEQLAAYTLINDARLPYSYAVVDKSRAISINKGKNYFISYSSFEKDYLLRDLNYFQHKNDREFLKHNPEIILPPSVFIFVYDQGNINDSDRLEKMLLILKKRGRTVQEVYQGEKFKVYEVINRYGESKIKDLLL